MRLGSPQASWDGRGRGPIVPARDRTPSVPGHEVWGVVTDLGYGTTCLTVGRRVFGLADRTRNGALAEYVAIETRDLEPLESRLAQQDLSSRRPQPLGHSGMTWAQTPSIAQATALSLRASSRCTVRTRRGRRCSTSAVAELRTQTGRSAKHAGGEKQVDYLRAVPFPLAASDAPAVLVVRSMARSWGALVRSLC